MNKYNVYWQDRKKGLEVIKENLTFEEANKVKAGLSRDDGGYALIKRISSGRPVPPLSQVEKTKKEVFKKPAEEKEKTIAEPVE